MIQKKPNFIRQDSNKLKCLGDKWRKPKGIHSKMRNNFKGHRKNISVGWKSTKEQRGLIGRLQNVITTSLSQIEGINPALQGITIANSVGLKKRISIINKAKEKGIKILNIRNVDKYIEMHNLKRAEKKKSHAKETPKAKEAVKELQKAKEEPAKEEIQSLETKPETETEESKEELDKLLTKRV